MADAAQFAANAPTGTAPRAAGDGTALAVDVQGVVFPDLLRAYGWQAVGVHRGEIDGRNATVVLYERDGRRIAYAVVAGDDVRTFLGHRHRDGSPQSLGRPRDHPHLALQLHLGFLSSPGRLS